MALFDDIKTTRGAKKSIKEIWEYVNDQKANDASLSGLNSPSFYALWRLWTFLAALVSWKVKALWTVKEKEIQTLVDANVGYNDQWLKNLLLKYQHGDAVELNPVDGRPYYSVVDEEKQIVKHVTVLVQNNSFYRAKISGEDVDGNKTKLSAGEVTGVNAYLDEIILGNNGIAESLDPDLAKLELTVYYDPIYEQFAVQELVESAITMYLDDLEGSGVWYESDLLEAIKVVEGVIDVTITSIQIKSATGVYNGETGRKYVPLAGYINVDPAYPLADNLTYIAE